MKHFKSEKNTPLLKIIGVILSLLFLGLPFIFCYELFFINHYWVNRIRLYRMLKKDIGELVWVGTYNSKVNIFSYVIDGHNYRIWLCNDALNLYSDDYNDYIGLFKTKHSILNLSHKYIINKLKSKIYEN